MKKIKTLACLALLTLTANAFANSRLEPVDCKTQSVEFQIGKIENLAGESSNASGAETFSELPNTTRILRGNILVIKECESINRLVIKKIMIPATAKMKLLGLNLRGGSLGVIGYNRTMTFSNLSGKNLENVLRGVFVGGKAAVTLSVALGVNPNASLLVNDSGAVLRDMEGIIGVGPSFAAGITLSKINIKFYADFERISDEDKKFIDVDL